MRVDAAMVSRVFGQLLNHELTSITSEWRSWRTLYARMTISWPLRNSNFPPEKTTKRSFKKVRGSSRGKKSAELTPCRTVETLVKPCWRNTSAQYVEPAAMCRNCCRAWATTGGG